MAISHELSLKLERHHAHKAIRQLMSEISTFQVIAYEVQEIDFRLVEKRLSETSYWACEPNKSLSSYAEAEHVETWIKEIVAAANFQGRAYLRTANLYHAGWTDVASDDLADAVWELWQRLDNKDVYLVSHDLARAVIFSSAEHFWLAYCGRPLNETWLSPGPGKA
jgi:hypothetical protein